MDKWWMLLFLVLLNGCVSQQRVECTKDSECAIGGCSSQVCTSIDKAKDLITTCEYREEYGCLKLTLCGCVDNKCQWNENEDYKTCLEEVRV